MFIVSDSQYVRPSSVGAARDGRVRSSDTLVAPHAAANEPGRDLLRNPLYLNGFIGTSNRSPGLFGSPTELGRGFGPAVGYKHGAPSGA